ncbi:flavo protein NADH-dependent oxidoreductase [Athelia psychrophila]|uniref:Flavo protein NADH-dependent oxidoreductase n=1 Tax=Athelia psychrophila TaxID=1759441 RepID=A0A166AUG7_9AGAM|nr:flavo protein NADH-dependent oxidoreductase [Fibularhizoctonia sp. CBS 109695]
MSIQPSDIGLPLKALREEITLGALTLKNRVIMSSLTRSRSDPVDVANDLNVEYYRQRAGAGLILSEGTLVSAQGTEWPHAPGIYSKEHADAWRKVTEAVHGAGGLMFAQLWHVGREAHPDMPLQKKAGLVSAPSPVSAIGGKFRTLEGAPGHVAPTREHPDPNELVQEFKRGAEFAKEAGFDGVELHGASGYLPHQFADKSSNIRTDKWGGSVENRARFFVETLNAIAEVFDSSRVGIKLSPWGEEGDLRMNEEDTKETFSYIIGHAVKLGLAYVQFSRSLPSFDPVFDQPGINQGEQRTLSHLDVVETFGPIIYASGGKTKLLLNGELSAAEAEKLVAEKKIDAAVIGRSFINNPDLVSRLFNAQPLNETLGFPLNSFGFYNFVDNPAVGYTDYPDIATAQAKAKTA